MKTAENMLHFPTRNSEGWTSDESEIVCRGRSWERVCLHLLKFPSLKWLYIVGGIHYTLAYTHWQTHLSPVFQK